MIPTCESRNGKAVCGRKDDYLIETLTDMALLTKEQVDSASRRSGCVRRRRYRYPRSAKNSLRPDDVARARAAHAEVEFVKLSDLRLPTT